MNSSLTLQSARFPRVPRHDENEGALIARQFIPPCILSTHGNLSALAPPPSSRLCQRNIVLQLERGLRVALSRHKLDLELVLDGKHGVLVEVFALLVEDLGSQGLVALLLDLLFGIR